MIYGMNERKLLLYHFAKCLLQKLSVFAPLKKVGWGDL
ncbi:hypothetical protein PCC7424_0234 [Gloeothece citriformis PCC 7424]|uniref:Uncharacterized protein n=1 Tax=Gloeothece citriformis (strain PCC 7424) TaxID=65393 RepID=B7KAN0_GLOC7|nr:hypothetical protein PCC7424_0234 [Gloeothece citriformis PCC 7424]